jgi:hypothetical protein
MAQRRMFSKTITSSGKFLKMPQSSRLLYYDLGMNADDDGYAEWFTVMKMTGAAEQDLSVLSLNGFVKIFDENVLVILDWKENNYIQKDRYTPSKYLGVYKMDTECIQNVNTGKDRLGKVRIGKDTLATEVAVEETPNQEDLANDFKTPTRGKKTKGIKSTSLISTPETGLSLNKQIVEIFNSFKDDINPTISFGNKTQRKACEELITCYGFDSVMFAIGYYKKIMGDKYSPVITTPYQLKEKYGQLRIIYQKSQKPQKGGMTII